MIKDGKGGDRTLTGLKFEERIDIRESIKKIEGYSVTDNTVYYKDSKVAQVFKKYSLYKELLEPKGIAWKNLISKQILPDETIFVLSNNTLFIIEMKFQNVAGSVDEKLQTCDFKKRQYTKLLSPLNINIEYVYVLNNWFKDPSYKDTLDYIDEVKCHYFFEKIPFEFLGLPIPNKN